jgi:hypothetical protein
MKKSIILVSLLLTLVAGTLSSAKAFSNQQHTITVTIQKFARVSVIGSADLTTTIQGSDVKDDGTVIKNFEQNPVKVRIRSNAPGGCDLSVSGSTSDQNFNTSLLQVSPDSNFSGNVATLRNSATVIKNFSSNEIKNDISLYWRVNGDVSGVTPDTAHITTVTYTVAAK